MAAMDTGACVMVLFLGFLAKCTANNSARDPTTQLPSEEKFNTTDMVERQVEDKASASTNTAAADSKVTTEKPLPTTAVMPISAVSSSNEPSPELDSPVSQNQTSIVPITMKQENSTVLASKEVTETSNKPEDVSTASKPGLNATETNNVKTTLPTISRYPDDWLHLFLRIHHFEGQYFYDGGKYLFDFVARNRHPLNSRTLVALFYDEEGAILEMNGTSADGHRITFVMNKVYTAGYRFPGNMKFELAGVLVASEHSTSYDGNITKPINSSFETFHMNKGLGVVETGDAAGARTAVIVVVPVSVAFLGIIATVTVLCWASKKGMLKGRHQSYQLFQDTPVVFESEAETIHI